MQQQAFSHFSIMKTTMCGTRKFWKEFIDLYKSFPVLWDIRHEKYKNKEIKDQCYKVLVNKMKTIDPSANQDSVRRKINILRTNFRRELNRVSCSNTNSTLWYFEDMMFTVGASDDKDNAMNSTSTSGMENEQDVDTSKNNETYSDQSAATDHNLINAKEYSYKPVKRTKIQGVQKNVEKSCIKNRKREYWTNFIKLYESFPALWNTNCPEYKNRKLKEECYEILINRLREIEPDADRAAVRKKINTLRCNFRREQNRIRIAQCSSKLWYYNHMLFLSNQENSENEKDGSVSDSADDLDVNQENSEIEKIESICDSADELDIKPDLSYSNFQSSNVAEPKQVDEAGCKSEIDTISSHSMTPNIFETHSSIFNKVTKSSDDEIDLQGKIWAAEFRKLTAEQQLFAKKAIDDILFERRLAGMVQSQNK